MRKARDYSTARPRHHELYDPLPVSQDVPVIIDDILEINLVLVGVSLVNTSEERATFHKDVATEIVSTETGLGAGIIERVHTLRRDRVRVVASIQPTGTPDRTIIAREYPDESDLDRLAEVAGMAIANTDLNNQTPRALGYNIELAYEPESAGLAIKYLADRLFIPSLLQDGGWQLSGGAGQLFFQKDDQNWRVRLEPRFNDDTTTKVFASINLHRIASDLALPTESSIRDSFQLLWGEAHQIVDLLDGGVV